jgi:hypothetical protein
VQLGRRDARADRVEVLDGLKGDATVLAVKFDNLREGGLASVKPAASTLPASTAAASAPSK